MVIPEFTKNKAKNEVLYLIASTGRIDRDDLRLLHISENYLNKVIFELKQEGLINISNTRPTVQSLTPKGVDLLWQKDQDAYEFFMKLTNGNHLSGSEEHRRRQQMVAQTMAQMYVSGVLIGSQKPTIEEVVEGVDPVLAQEKTYFYLNKEIKHNNLQKQGRQQLSRSIGVLLAPAMRAVVYNLLDRQMFLAQRTESIAHLLLDVTATTLYGEAPSWQKKASIVLCGDDKSAAEIFRKEAAKGERKGIGTAIQNRGITKTDFHYVPAGRLGELVLHIITQYAATELLEHLFDPDEIARAKECGVGEAVINGLYCYEFISGNVSKLHRIRTTNGDLAKVGIACIVEQREFLWKFFGTKDIKLRGYTQGDLRKRFNI